MERVNNKHGIVMYWELANDVNKVNILDSNGNYFNDLYYENYEEEDDIKAIINTLENTTIENMCNFFNTRFYQDLDKLIEENNLDETKDNILNNAYLNKFMVNGQVFYTWSW